MAENRSTPRQPDPDRLDEIADELSDRNTFRMHERRPEEVVDYDTIPRRVARALGPANMRGVGPGGANLNFKNIEADANEIVQIVRSPKPNDAVEADHKARLDKLVVRMTKNMKGLPKGANAQVMAHQAWVNFYKIYKAEARPQGRGYPDRTYQALTVPAQNLVASLNRL